MRIEQAMLELPGGGPKPPRPDRRDPRVLAVAAARLAEALCRSRPEYGTPEELAEGLLSCRANGTDDGFEVARKLGSIGFEQDAELVEDMDGWPGAVSKAEGEAVRGWVALWRPECPFEGPARVVTSGQRPHRGYAYRTPDYDAKALCVVVDDEADRPVNGGYIVPWEDLAEIGEPTAEHVALETERLAQEEKWRRSKVRDRFLGEATSRRRDAVAKAKVALAGMGDQDVRVALESAAQDLLERSSWRIVGRTSWPRWTSCRAASTNTTRIVVCART